MYGTPFTFPRCTVRSLLHYSVLYSNPLLTILLKSGPGDLDNTTFDISVLQKSDFVFIVPGNEISPDINNNNTNINGKFDPLDGSFTNPGYIPEAPPQRSEQELQEEAQQREMLEREFERKRMKQHQKDLDKVNGFISQRLREADDDSLYAPMDTLMDFRSEGGEGDGSDAGERSSVTDISSMG